MLPIRYRIDGQPRISVTQVLTLAGRIETQWFTEEAAERGSCVHRWTEHIDRGEYAPDLPHDWQGYAEAYLTFLAEVRPEWDDIEKEVYHKGLCVAGRIDRRGRVHGHRGIVDIKTGGKSSWHGQQLGAYNLALPTGCRWGLYLASDGRYQLVQYTSALDYRLFLADVARVQGTVMPNGDFWVPAAA